jgi:hypothetical protein
VNFIRIHKNCLLLIMLLNSFTDHSFDVVTRYQVETNAGRWRAIRFRCHFFKAVRHTLEPGRLQFWKGHNSSQTYHSWGGSNPFAAQMAIRNQRQLLWDNRLIFLPGKWLSNIFKFFNSLTGIWILPNLSVHKLRQIFLLMYSHIYVLKSKLT